MPKEPNWRIERPAEKKESEFFEEFINRPNYGISQGGCDTCGYGAEQGITAEEFKTVLIEMDEWIIKKFVSTSL